MRPVAASLAKIAASLALVSITASQARAGDPNGPVRVSAGTIVDLGVVHSEYADPRRIVVWLPSGYRPHGPKYAVLYMHDGQNLFDKATAGYGMDWEIDEHLDALIREKKASGTRPSGSRNMSHRRLSTVCPRNTATISAHSTAATRFRTAISSSSSASSSR